MTVEVQNKIANIFKGNLEAFLKKEFEYKNKQMTNRHDANDDNIFQDCTYIFSKQPFSLEVSDKGSLTLKFLPDAIKFDLKAYGDLSGAKYEPKNFDGISNIAVQEALKQISQKFGGASIEMKGKSFDDIQKIPQTERNDNNISELVITIPDYKKAYSEYSKKEFEAIKVKTKEFLKDQVGKLADLLDHNPNTKNAAIKGLKKSINEIIQAALGQEK